MQDFKTGDLTVTPTILIPLKQITDTGDNNTRLSHNDSSPGTIMQRYNKSDCNSHVRKKRLNASVR